MTYETDERLKSFLDANQLQRERLCLAVLSLDHRYSQARPRQPRGGPDQGCDIDIVFEARLPCAAAVGFTNQASDTAKEISAAKRKFNVDIQKALRLVPPAKGFVFLTNVNLTHGAKQDLTRSALAQGFEHCEIYDRERIRVVLDSPDGFAARFQFLGIPLSEPEQATFFARWGSDINSVIASGFGDVRRMLNRMEFLNEIRFDLSRIVLEFELTEPWATKEFGHFRVSCRLHIRTDWDLHGLDFFVTDNVARRQPRFKYADLPDRPDYIPGFVTASWNEYLHSVDDEGKRYAGIGERRHKLDRRLCATGSSPPQSSGKTLTMKLPVFQQKDMQRMKLADLDGATVSVSVNASLIDKIISCKIFANDYLLAAWTPMVPSKAKSRVRRKFRGLDDLYEFTKDEENDWWVSITGEMFSTVHLDFRAFTPRRETLALDISG